MGKKGDTPWAASRASAPGAIVGILIVVFILLLVGVDVTCYFLNKCGLLMCIAVNFCGKAGPGAKAKDIEEGKAAFTKDESKEPIVETTPLTEPDGKTVKDDNAKAETEVKNATAEVKTVPNEAPQANGNEMSFGSTTGSRPVWHPWKTSSEKRRPEKVQLLDSKLLLKIRSPSEVDCSFRFRSSSTRQLVYVTKQTTRSLPFILGAPWRPNILKEVAPVAGRS
ncbi:unnamed protein product [Pleuronectes platessa]|uniref:Uncharacterized protein n=1 Tax=Pleuronectes platessa TaxID=8262 RepID=A0A9N7V9A3_PLEPL|nr:unnamed protein product [Pleuronectes platessa]